MRRFFRRTVIALALLLALLSLGVLLLYSPVGGELLRRATERGVSSLIAGSLRVGEIEFHGFDEIVAHDARLLDPEGRVVVEAEELVLSMEPLALLRMEISMPEVALRRGELRLYEGEDGLPSFLDALGPAEPSEDDSPSGITARVPAIVIEDLDVHGELLGVTGLRIEGARLEGGLEFLDDELTLVVRSFEALVTGPVKRPLPVRGGDVVVGTAPEVGSRLTIVAGDDEEWVSLDARYALPSPDASEEVVSLDARLHGVRPESLAELGLEGLDAITGEVSGTIEAHGPVDALAARASLRHAAGEVELEGTVGETTTLRARSERFEVKRLVPDAPDVSPSVDATLTLREGRAPRVEAALSPMKIGDVTLPATRSSVVLEDDRLDLSVQSTAMSTGELDLEGSVHDDGRLDLRVRARLSRLEATKELRALTGELRGGASVDAQIRGTIDDPRVRGGVVIAPFAYGPVKAARLAVSGDVHALAAAPSLSVDVLATNVSLWDRPVDDVALTVRGKRGALVAIGSLGREGAGTIDARFDLGETFRLHHGVVRTPRFQLDARDVNVSERVTELGSVHVQLGRARLVLSGTLRERGDDRVQLEVADLPISDVRTLVELPFEALEGTISLHAEAEGELERDPTLLVQGVVEGIHGGGVEDAFASLFFRHTGGHSLGQLQIELGEGGSAAVGLNAYVDLGRDDLEAALTEAYFDLSIDVLSFDLGLTRPVLPEELGEVTGQVDGSMRLSGTIDAIEADARVETRNMRIFDLPELTYVVAVQKQYGSLSIDVAASDATGLLGEARASTVGNVLEMLREPETALESLAAAPWLFYARLPERRLGDLPAKLLAEIPEDLEDAHVALSLDAQGGSLEPRVDLSGVALIPENVASFCGAGREVSLPFTLRVRDGDASLDGDLLLGSRVAGTVQGKAAPALARWLERGELEPTPIEIGLSLSDARLGNLPFVCRYASGELSGALTVRELMGDAPRLTGYFQSNDVRIRRDSEVMPGATFYETPPLSLGATIAIDTEQTLVELTLRAGVASRLRVDGTAPVSLVPRGLASFDEEADFSLFFDVEDAPLSLLLGFVPAFANVEGTADGWGRLGGTLDNPDHHAELAIHDGRFTIVSLGQRVSEVEGIATLDPGSLKLKHFRARDGDGRVLARGEMDIENLAPTRASLDVELDGFPVRDEGTIVAALSGRGDLDARFTPDSADAELVLRDLEIDMPALGGPSIQDLAEHPDVRIVTELDREDDEEDAPPFSLELHVDATEPFDVKGPDFSATLTADLNVMLEGESLRIGGHVDLKGGRFAVLGKPFTVTSGSLRFDPRDETLSPAVSLEAVYLVDGDRNKRVTVSVGGTLSEPTVRFASNVPTRNEGEIISLIVTGETHAETERGVDSAAAGRDAADFVAGVAFGVVSLSLREEFGGFLPVVTLEGQNRFRARFDAERFLPESVRKIVKRVRIEGYFTAGQPGEEGQVRQSGQARGAGFSVELGFPRGIVGRGTVAPPNNWSTQVLWEP